jgi:molybdenum cofactor cytidylyltransferase
MDGVRSRTSPLAVAGLLLAAGAGRRLGRPKALVEIDGETLAVRGVRLLADAGCRPVVVVVGSHADEVIAAVRLATAPGPRNAPESHALSDIHKESKQLKVTTPVGLIRSDRWVEGLGASLRTGLTGLADPAALTDPTGLAAPAGLADPDAEGAQPDDGGRLDAVVVTLVDQPALTSAAVRRLVAAASPGGDHEHRLALTATYLNKPGHPVLLRRAAWAPVAALAHGDVGARAWLRANPDHVGRVPCDGLGSPADIDTPGDLRDATDRRPGGVTGGAASPKAR